jgi:hypothetical protein
VEGVGGQVVVAEHHGLGAASGAARIEEARELASASRRRPARLAGGDQALIRVPAGVGRLALARMDELAHAPQLAAHALHDRSEVVVYEQDARPTVVHHVRDLRRREAHVDRNEHRGPRDALAQSA